MSLWEGLAGLLGGVGLFLLGMELMTEGLKLAAGPQLERMLARATSSRWRALVAGMSVTALVQSSSAVTVAAIGFVNAGLLSLGQVMWVLFGANVGTTMTGWLVAMVGLKFKVEVLALPLLGVGMALRLTGSGHRRGAMGQALAGFGLLFVGIGILQQTFTGVATEVQLPEGSSAAAILLQLLTGMALTILMQSSSASLTLALSAAAGGLLSPQGAAAVVIGANVGTTVTAALAAVGATSNARRAAAAHVLFNLLTGLVALLLLPWLVSALATLRQWLGLTDDPAAQLALFHTIFNVLGVLLMWPLAARLTAFLERRFRAAEEDEAKPRFLDQNVMGVPALAMDAVDRELRRLALMVGRVVAQAFGSSPVPRPGRDRAVIERLRKSIVGFIVQLSRAGLSEDSAHRLPQLLRVARHCEVAAQRANEAGGPVALPAVASEAAKAFRERALAVVAAVATEVEGAPGEQAVAGEGGSAAAAAAFEMAYEDLKAALLLAGSAGVTAVEHTDLALEWASDLHRAVLQLLQAAYWLAPPLPTVEASAAVPS